MNDAKARKDAGRPQPTFLLKTYEMIGQTDVALGGWSEDGETFTIRDPKRFATEVIPKYFKHSNFSSFVRQLNFYGFHKLKNDSSVRCETELSWWQFRHEFFVRGQVHLLGQIKRKTYADPTCEAPFCFLCYLLFFMLMLMLCQRWWTKVKCLT
jgi:hypothetical protein